MMWWTKFRRWWIARMIRKRLTTAPYFGDFLYVKRRKSAAMAIYIQGRVTGDEYLIRRFRKEHLNVGRS